MQFLSRLSHLTFSERGVSRQLPRALYSAVLRGCCRQTPIARFGHYRIKHGPCTLYVIVRNNRRAEPIIMYACVGQVTHRPGIGSRGFKKICSQISGIVETIAVLCSRAVFDETMQG